MMLAATAARLVWTAAGTLSAASEPSNGQHTHATNVSTIHAHKALLTSLHLISYPSLDFMADFPDRPIRQCLDMVRVPTHNKRTLEDRFQFSVDWMNSMSDKNIGYEMDTFDDN